MQSYFLRFSIGFLFVFNFFIYEAYADSNHHAGLDLTRPDSHAPIGVMGDHLHGEGEVMLSYRYMFMNMEHNQIRDNEVTHDRVLQDFMVTPTDMQMQMHMIGAMYAASDDITLMMMFPIIRKDMNHLVRNGVQFRTNSEGLGDISLTGLIPIHKDENKQWHANLGMSFPTGSINQIDDLPAGKGKRLPYPMQLGSGTIDLKPGVTYTEQINDISFGAQIKGDLKMGRNRIGYSLGDKLDSSIWVSKIISKEWSASGRLDYKLWSNIDGSDSSLNSNMVPTADPKSRGGKRIDLLFGVNYYCQKGVFKGHRFSVEAGLPVFESLDGPQLSTDWFVTLGWQKAY